MNSYVSQIKSRILLLSVALTLITAMGSAPILGQGEAGTETDRGEQSGAKEPAYVFSPEAKTDLRFKVQRLSVSLRVDPYARGEILDVFFNIENNTQKPIDLYGFVLAYHESDSVDRSTRLWIPYPDWRSHDPAKSTYLIKEMAITPAPIDQGKIWTEDDPEYIKYHKILNRIRNSVGASKPLADIYPPIYRYLNYIASHPTEGLSFRLYGKDAPSKEESIISNYPAIDKNEEKYKRYAEVIKHTYTLQFSRRQTVFRSHHFVEYGPSFRMFNKIAIVLFDAEKAQQFAGLSPEEKSKTESPMVYYRTYSIDRELKIY